MLALAMTRKSRRTTLTSLQKRLDELNAEVQRLQALEAQDRVMIEETRMSLPKTARRPAALAAGSAQRIPVIVPEPEVEVPLATRIEALLRQRSLSLQELVEELSEDGFRVGRAFAAMRKRGNLANVGTEERPRYVWVPGDGIPTPELHALVERLVREHPMTFAMLAAATGANPNRIKHALTTLQGRKGDPVHNYGSRNRAVWFIRPAPKR